MTPSQVGILRRKAKKGKNRSRRGLTPAQLALAWVLRRPEVTAAIVGARRPEQIEETVAAAGVTLTADDHAALNGMLQEREAN